MGPRFLAIAALGLAGCGGGGRSDGFDIDVTLDVERGCPSPDCSSYPMACGGLLSVRVVDAESGEVYTEDCVALEGADLCALQEAPVTLDPVPDTMVRIEVAVWSPEELDDPEVCPSGDIFDNQPNGAPRSSFQPNPGFGGATYFDAGSAERVEVLLTCPDFRQINDPTCRLLVSAGVDDLTSGFFVRREEASDLAVSVGEPVSRPIDKMGEEVEWVLEPDQLSDLELNVDLAIPRWFGDVPEQLEQRACLLVVNFTVPEATAAVTCEVLGAEQTDIQITGLYLPKEILDGTLLPAANLDSVPSGGIVIGRVFDHLGQPAAGVEVRAVGGGADVEYLDAANVTFEGPSATEGEAWFKSENAAFGTVWEAESSDGRRENGVYTAGLIVGRVSVLLIRLEPPVAE